MKTTCRHARGLGLGRELLRLSMEVAAALGCESYFSAVSNIYSQRIFSDSGFVVMRQLDYSDFVDEKDRSRNLLGDMGEHNALKTVSFKLI